MSKKIVNAECGVRSAECGIQKKGFRIPNSEFRINSLFLSLLVFGHRSNPASGDFPLPQVRTVPEVVCLWGQHSEGAVMSRWQSRRQNLFLMAVTAIIIFSCSTVVNAQPGVEASLGVTTVKEVTGEIGAVRGMIFTVIYAKDLEAKSEDEMMFPRHAELLVMNRKSLDELNAGDQVRVTYEESVWTDDEGNERHARKALSVRFLSVANSGLTSGE